MLKTKKLFWTSLALIALIAVICGWLYSAMNKSQDSDCKATVSAPSKEVADAPKVDVPVPSVQVYSGGTKLKQKLSLPKTVSDNDKQQVIASSQIDASERPHTVTTVIDTDTGKSETYVHADPLPWLAYSSKGGLGVYYGLKDGDRTLRLQARQDIMQIKAVRLGAIASIDRSNSGRTDTYVGVGAEYRW